MSKIEWTDKTWNPITGCTPVGEGCRNCYARRMATRLRGRYGYPANDPFRVTFHPDKLVQPLKWKKPCRIFVCSMGDLFHEDVEPGELFDVYEAIKRTPEHEYVILTKRPDRIVHQFGLQPNVTMGVSCWDQESADRMIPGLLETPAARRIVSLEPLLGPVDIGPYIQNQCETCYGDGEVIEMVRYGGPPIEKRTPCPDCEGEDFVGLDGVIVGGESGPGARPMHPDWVRSIRDQCVEAEVHFFFKQWGWHYMSEIGKRLLDGREWNEWPEYVR